MYVMTSDFGAAEPAREDRHARLRRAGRAQQVRQARRRRRAARRAQAVEAQPRRVPDRRTRTCRSIPTIASQFNDPGISWMFANLCRLLREKLSLPARQVDAATRHHAEGTARHRADPRRARALPRRDRRAGPRHQPPDRDRRPKPPTARSRYWQALQRARRRAAAEAAGPVRRRRSRRSGRGDDRGAMPTSRLRPLRDDVDRTLLTLRQRYNDAVQSLTTEALKLLREWPARLKSITDEVTEYQVRDKTIRVENYRESLSHQKIPKIAAPTYKQLGRAADLPAEGKPAGLLPLHRRRVSVPPHRRRPDPHVRGRGHARAHQPPLPLPVSVGQPAARLSTAFDCVTLYGEDPAPRPDIYGKIGNSGVNIATLDDMKKLYSGFDLCAPTTVVSMTINGPAPMILAMFMNTAIDQQVEKYLRGGRRALGRRARRRSTKLFEGRKRPSTAAMLPADQRRPRPGPARRHRRPGGRRRDLRAHQGRRRCSTVRGTVQADILKEDQAQNTCIFSTEFALRMMGDIQQYFVDNKVRNFYSVSISGYHIAEAGANPISQLAFTLSNGFTIVEYYLARGMKIDDFAPNLSFFFSNGMDPEYTVIGRVARRIWARAMRERYGADRAQPDDEVPHPDQRPLAARAGDPVQRHPHHAAGAVRAVRQLQQPAHQRLRRSHHHADRGKRAPRGGDPDDHQQGAGAQLHARTPGRAASSSTSSPTSSRKPSTRSSRPSASAAACSARWTPCTSAARSRKSRCTTSTRSTTAALPLVGVNTFLPKEHAGEIATEIELIRSTEEEKGQQIANVRATGSRRAMRWRRQARPRIRTWRMPMKWRAEVA